MKKHIVFSLINVLFVSFLYAQPNDIMIVEYVDWDPGNGWGIKIYNPTAGTINLSPYVVRVFNNGGTGPTGTLNLSGNILPGETKIIGNQEYCGTYCGGSCDYLMNNSGVNGNDCIAISYGLTTNWVDMINLYGVDVFPRIGGFTQALLHNKIVRNSNNCTRYTSTNGSGLNSWPNNSVVNFPGWTVQGISCISQGFSLAQVPQFSLPNDTTLCLGQSYTIHTGLSAPNTFIWSTGQTTPSITVSSTGLYRLILNPGGCESRDSIQVTFVAVQPPSLENDTATCYPDSLVLNAGTGYSSYLWNTGDTSPSIVPDTFGIFSVTVTLNGCSSSDSILISAPPPMSIDLGNDTMLCRLAGFSLDAGPGYDNYLWNTIETAQVIFPQNMGLYSVRVNKGFCAASDSILISELPPMSINLGNDTILCRLAGFSLDAGPGYDNYLWNTIETAQMIFPQSAGLYSVRANKGFCLAEGEILIRLYPSSGLDLGEDIEKCPDAVVTLNTPFGYMNYQWSTGGNSNSENVTDSGWIYVAATDINDCVFEDSVLITYIDCDLFVPNTITPNGDGKNDYFFIKGLRGTTELFVYNRWGKEVFSSGNYDNAWDGGSISGGTYLYTLKTNGQDYKGWIYVVK